MVHAMDERTWVWRGGEWRRYPAGGALGVCVGGRIVVLDDATAKRALASATLRRPPNLKAYSPECRTTHHLRSARRLVQRLTSLLVTAPTRLQMTTAPPTRPQLTPAPRESISTSVQTVATSIPAATACSPVPVSPPVVSASLVAARSLSNNSLTSHISLDSSSSSDGNHVSNNESRSESDKNPPSKVPRAVQVLGNGIAMKLSRERVSLVRAWLARGRVPGALQSGWRRLLYRLNPLVILTPSPLLSGAVTIGRRESTTLISANSPVTKPGQCKFAIAVPRQGPVTQPNLHKQSASAAPTRQVTGKHNKVASPTKQLTKTGARKLDRAPSPKNQFTNPSSRKHTISESSKIRESKSNSSSIYQFRQPYSAEEDEKLIQWLCQDRRWERVGGVTLWRQLETSIHLPNRTWQSLKNRYYKNLLQRLHTLVPLHLVHEMRASARPGIQNALDKKKKLHSQVDKAWAR